MIENVISGDICFRNWAGFILLSPKVAFVVAKNHLHLKLEFEFGDFEFVMFNGEYN